MARCEKTMETKPWNKHSLTSQTIVFFVTSLKGNYDIMGEQTLAVQFEIWVSFGWEKKNWGCASSKTFCCLGIPPNVLVVSVPRDSPCFLNGCFTGTSVLPLEIFGLAWKYTIPSISWSWVFPYVPYQTGQTWGYTSIPILTIHRYTHEILVAKKSHYIYPHEILPVDGKKNDILIGCSIWRNPNWMA